MVSYIILALFFAAAALNLAGTKKGREKLFAATKPFLLSLLCLYSVTRTLPTPDLLLSAALLACFLGDVLLMPKGTGWFVAGGLRPGSVRPGSR